MKQRCKWAKPGLLEKYHDTEWGVPLYDDDKLFEFLVLDAFQAGLSWEIVLKKRQALHDCFACFKPETVAAFGDSEINSLLNNPGIIRNRQKISASITNARMFLSVKEKIGSFSEYIWQFTGGKPIINAWEKDEDTPAKTETSHKMSKDLKKLGFKFVGSTICYAFMQAAGMVNDHIVTCFRFKEVMK